MLAANARNVKFEERRNMVKTDHPVKITALAYLRAALNEERYEDMAEIVAIAREFGADEWDLHRVLTRQDN